MRHIPFTNNASTTSTTIRSQTRRTTSSSLSDPLIQKVAHPNDERTIINHSLNMTDSKTHNIKDSVGDYDTVTRCYVDTQINPIHLDLFSMPYIFFVVEFVPKIPIRKISKL